MLGLRLALGAIALMAVLTASVGGLAVMDFHGSEAATQIELRLGGVGDYWDALANGAREAAAQRGVELTVSDEIQPAGFATLTILLDQQPGPTHHAKNSSLELQNSYIPWMNKEP